MRTTLYDRVEKEEIVLNINPETFRKCKSAKSVKKKHLSDAKKFSNMPRYVYDFETFQARHSDGSVYMEPYQCCVLDANDVDQAESSITTFNSCEYPDLVPSLLNHIYELASPRWKKLISKNEEWAKKEFGENSFFIPRVSFPSLIFSVISLTHPLGHTHRSVSSISCSSSLNVY